MVAALNRHSNGILGWGVFVALSLYANLYLLNMVSFKAPIIEIPKIEKIRISLKTLAAPKAVITPEPVKVAEVEPITEPMIEPIVEPKIFAEPPQPPVPATPKIVTAAQAETKIAVVKKVEPIPDPPAFKPVKVVDVKAPEAKPIPLPVRKPTRLAKLPEPILKPVQDVKLAETPKKIKEQVKTQIAKVAEEATPRPVETMNSDTQAPETTEKPIETASLEGSGGAGNAASTVIQNAKYRKRIAPKYPRRALNLGQQGTVTLHALVNTAGRAKDLKIENSSGYRLLDKAAVAAVAKWEFEPETRSGQKIETWVRVPVNFVIR